MCGNDLRREDRAHQLVEVVAVLRHADGGGELDLALAREAGEIRIEHGAENFADAVGAEVEAQHAVAVPDAAIVADHRRHDELVELLLRIGVGDGGLRIGKARAVGLDDGVIGFGDALPALVAVHGVVAAEHGRDRNRRRQRRGESLEIVAGRLRRRIAAVGDGMRHGRHAGVGEDFRQRRAVVLVRMHAAGRNKPDQVAGAAAFFQRVDQAGQRRRRLDLARRDGVADARQVLHHHAASADVEVADLGVAHLARRQPDLAAVGAQERVRTAGPQPVECRRPGLADGVVGRVLAPAPAVEHDQHDGAALLFRCIVHRRLDSDVSGEGQSAALPDAGDSALKDQARRRAVGEQSSLVIREPSLGGADAAAAVQRRRLRP